MIKGLINLKSRFKNLRPEKKLNYLHPKMLIKKIKQDIGPKGKINLINNF